MKPQVLIVDDDMNVQKMLQTALELAHFEVLTASNGQDALLYLAQTLPALIVLDVMMPTMDGPAFVEELERRGLRSSIPVLVLTANMYALPLIERMHPDASLSKPFRLAELLQHIRRLVSQYHDRPCFLMEN